MASATGQKNEEANQQHFVLMEKCWTRGKMPEGHGKVKYGDAKEMDKRSITKYFTDAKEMDKKLDRQRYIGLASSVLK